MYGVFLRRQVLRIVATALLCIGAGAYCFSAEAQPLARGSRPNILLIVADDLGYNDLGVFGSEIRTPNIDRLAKNGTILTNYYTAPLCAPTRAMLLSGTDHHRAGEGRMAAFVDGAPGYEGYLNHHVVSLATRLKSSGYHTYMAGKWHLGLEDDQTPVTHGFERSFVLLDGAGDHFQMRGQGPFSVAKYREDGKLVDALPKDFYSTNFYTDKMLDYFKSNAKKGEPFFAYLAYTAPHWPMQAPAEDIARQRGRYDEGYEVLRQRRFEAWKAKGFAPKDAQMPNLPGAYRPWASLTEEEKAKSSRTMEVYAAMVEHMDMSIGRVLDYLEKSGQLDNTLIMFESDNGAEGGGVVGGQAATLEQIGQPGVWTAIGSGWAEAGSVPFYLQKFSAAEGGIHVPAIVSAPKLGVPSGRRDDSVLIAYDVAPTFLELAGVNPKAPVDRPDALPITGRSFVTLLRGDNRQKRGASDVLGWEHQGNASVRKGDWKLLWMNEPAGGQGTRAGGAGPRAGGAGARGAGAAGAAGARGAGAAETAGAEGAAGAAGGARGAGPGGGASPLTRAALEAGGPAGTPTGSGGIWKLFNLRDDPAELHDQSAKHPEMFKEMLREWDRYVAENGVVVKQGK